MAQPSLIRRLTCTLSLALLLGTTCMTAQAKPRRVEMQVAENQSRQYVDGVTWTVVANPAIALGVAASANDKNGFWLTVAMSNQSDHAIDLLPDAIRAQSDGASLKVFSTEEVVPAQIKRDKWEKFGQALGAVGDSINAKNAGYYQQNGTFNGGFRGNQGSSGNFNGSYFGSGYDGAAAQRAQSEALARARQTADNMHATQSDRLNALHARLLLRNTINPGSGARGDVLIELPRQDRHKPTKTMQISVPIEGQDYTFSIRVAD